MIFILNYIYASKIFFSSSFCSNMSRCRLERFLNLNGFHDVGSKVSIPWAIRLKSIVRIDASIVTRAFNVRNTFYDLTRISSNDIETIWTSNFHYDSFRRENSSCDAMRVIELYITPLIIHLIIWNDET